MSEEGDQWEAGRGDKKLMVEGEYNQSTFD
jgi:hypothetical protein